MIIIGLGNPGGSYETTRHNLGWWVIDKLTQDETIKFIPTDTAPRGGLFHAVHHARYRGKGLILAKPNTYVNLTGKAVIKIMAHYRADLTDLAIITDDMHLDIGQIRIRKTGGSGNHNGLASIISELQSENFMRVRIGIGKPASSHDWKSYVLQQVPKNELSTLQAACDTAHEAVKSIVTDGIDRAMNHYNGTP